MRTRLPRPRASTAPGFLVVALVLVGSLAACDDEPKSNVEPIDAAGADADADGVSGTDTIDADVAPETGSTGDSDAGGDAVADTDVTADAPADIEAGASDVAPDAEPDVGFDGVPVPIEEPEGYRDRRAEYLAWCVDRTDPGEGGLYGQCCRVYAGETDLDDGPIDSALAQLEERRDTADFRANGLVRLLYLDDATGALGDERRDSIRQTLIDFKYWLDEPGSDGMAYWTENHQILYHTAELLIGQREPDTVFSNSGMTGADHVAHALPRLDRWLDLRGRYGFSEWHSNVYFNEDIPALVNLVDFAEDETIRAKATVVLDLLALDLLENTYRGRFATTHGRVYQGKFINGLNDSTQEAAWIMTGLGSYDSGDNFSAAFLATSDYYTPGILADLATAVSARHEHRQRDSFDIEEGPALGISYEGVDDVVVWAGLSAIVAPDVIDGAMDVMEEHDLWGGFLFGSLPPELLTLLQTLMGTPGLRNLAVDLEPLSRGMALESVDTYVYRTPDYQVAAAQDYKPGQWAAQTLMWQATLDSQAFVIATVPAALGVLGELDEVTIDEPWIGGWLPRATVWRNVSVVQFRQVEMAPIVDTLATAAPMHAFFPRDRFDEVREEGEWRFGRKGDGYLALWCDRPLVESEDNDYELVAETTEGVFVVELGSAEEHGDFDAFVSAFADRVPTVDDEGLVVFESPTVGEVRVGWEGPMTVAGEEVDIGPYDRWDNAFVQQTRGESRLRVRFDDHLFVLDFEAGERRLFSLP